MTDLIDEKNRQILFAHKSTLPANALLMSLEKYLATLGGKKKLVLISKSFKEKNEKLCEKLALEEENTIECTGEPTTADLEAYKKKLAEGKYDYVLAIGGGSVMDLAKAAKETLNFSLVVAPTTPATGSEATPYAILHEDGNKKIIFSHRILPEVALLDSDLLSTLSKEQLGYAYMDILSHALEALVSKRANPLSDGYARIALQELKKYEKAENKLQTFLIAGFFAGLAQGSASVGYVHAFSHVIGAQKNIAHSKAITIFLQPVVKLMLEKTDAYNKLVNTGWKAETLLKDIQAAQEAFGLESQLKENVDEEVVQLVKRDICTMTSPYRASDEELKEILKEAGGTS